MSDDDKEERKGFIVLKDASKPAEQQPKTEHAEHHAAHAEHAEHQHGHTAKRSIVVSFTENVFQKKYIFSVIIYAALAIAMFAPIFANMASTAPGYGGDVYLNLWDVWWVNYATFTAHTTIWSTNLLFWPVGSNLAYQTMSPIGSLLVGPFTAISVPFAYNVLFLLGFVLSGLTMFILAEYLTKNPYAAFFAGLVFAFSASHIPLALDHIDWTNIEWIPLSIYFFLRVVREYENKYINAVGLGVTFVLTVFMGDIEQGLMLAMLYVLILLVYLLYKGTRHLVFNPRLILALIAAIAVACVVGAFGFLPMLNAISQSGGISNANYLNDVQHNELWSVDLLSFFIPSYYNGVFNGIESGLYNTLYHADPSEATSYIGYTVLALAVFAIYTDYKKVRLWIIIALLSAWMATGPYLQINTYVSPIPGIYALYHAIPVINVIREPDRFDIIFSVAMAALAAFGITELMERSKKMNAKSLLGNGLYLVLILSVLFIIENNGFPLTSALQSQDYTSISIPHFFYLIDALQQNFSILQLPIITDQYSSVPELYLGQATYYETADTKPLVGGDTTRPNDSDELSLYNLPLAVQAYNLQVYGELAYQSPVNENYTNQTLLTLYNYGTGFIVIDNAAYNYSAFVKLGNYLYSVFGVPIYQDNYTTAFQTSKAISNSIYRSYVAYPILTNWQPVSLNINGSSVSMWLPSYPGTVEVYAPYVNSTNLTQAAAGGPQYAFTNMQFRAISLTGSNTVLEIAALSDTGTVSPLTAVNITAGLADYGVQLAFPSGPQGTTLMFISSAPNSTSTVALSNITFSKYAESV